MKIEQASATTLAAGETINDLKGIITINNLDKCYLGNVDVTNKFNTLLSKLDPKLKRFLEEKIFNNTKVVICECTDGRWWVKEVPKEFPIVNQKIKIIPNSNDIAIDVSYEVEFVYGSFVEKANFIINITHNSWNIDIVVGDKKCGYSQFIPVEVTSQEYNLKTDELGFEGFNLKVEEGYPDFGIHNYGTSQNFSHDTGYFFTDTEKTKAIIDFTAINNTSVREDQVSLDILNKSGEVLHHASALKTNFTLPQVYSGTTLILEAKIFERASINGHDIIAKNAIAKKEITINSGKENYNETINIEEKNVSDYSSGIIELVINNKTLDKELEALNSDPKYDPKIVLSGNLIESGKKEIILTKEIRDSGKLVIDNLYYNAKSINDDYKYSMNLILGEESKKDLFYIVYGDDVNSIKLTEKKATKELNYKIGFKTILNIVSSSITEDYEFDLTIDGISKKVSLPCKTELEYSVSHSIKLRDDKNIYRIENEDIIIRKEQQNIGQETKISFNIKKNTGKGSLNIDLTEWSNLSDTDEIKFILNSVDGLADEIIKTFSSSEKTYLIENIPNDSYNLIFECVSKKNILRKYRGKDYNIKIEEEQTNITSSDITISEEDNSKVLGIKLASYAVEDSSLEGKLTVKDPLSEKPLIDNKQVTLNKETCFIVEGIIDDPIDSPTYDIIFTSNDYYFKNTYNPISSNNIAELKNGKEIFHISLDSSNKPGGKLNSINLTVEDTTGYIEDFVTKKVYNNLLIESLPITINYLKNDTKLKYKLSVSDGKDTYNNGEEGITKLVSKEPVDILLNKISNSGEVTINISGASDKPILSLDIKQGDASIEGYPHGEVEFPHKIVLPNGSYNIEISGSSVANSYSGSSTIKVEGNPVSSTVKLEPTQKNGTLIISATNEKFLGDPVFNLILQDTETTVESKAVAAMFPYTWKNVKPGSYNLKINASTPEAKYTLKPTKVTVKPGIKNEISVTLEEKITAKSNITINLDKKYEEDGAELTVKLNEVGGKKIEQKTSSNTVIFENVNPASYMVEVSCDADDEFNKHHGKTSLPFVVKEGEPKEVTVEVVKEAFGIITVDVNASSIPDTSLKIEIRENNKNGKLVDSGTIKSTVGQYVSKKILRGKYAIHAEGKNGGVVYSSSWQTVDLNSEAASGSLELSGSGSLLLDITSDTSMTCRFVLQQTDGPAKVEKTQGITAARTETVKFTELPIGTYNVDIFNSKTNKPVVITSENNKDILVQQENYKLEMTVSNRGNAVITLTNSDEIVLPSDNNTTFGITMNGPEKIEDKDIPLGDFPFRKENLEAGKYNINIVSKNGAYILTKTNVVEVLPGVEFTQLGLELKRATVGTLTANTEALEGINKEDAIEITISQEAGTMKPITKNTVIGKEVKFSGLTAGDYNVSAVVKDKAFKSNIEKVTIDEKSGIEKASSLKFSRIEKFSTVKLKVSPSEGSQEMDNAEVDLLIKKESGEEVLHKTYNSLELNGGKSKVLLEPGIYIATLSGHDNKNTYINDPAVENKIKVIGDEGTIVFDIKYTSSSKTKRNLSIDINPKIEEPLTVKLDNEVKESNVTQFPFIINDLDQGKTYNIEISNENYKGTSSVTIEEKEENSITVELTKLNANVTLTQINGPKEQLTGTFNFNEGSVEGTFGEPIKLPIGKLTISFTDKNGLWLSEDPPLTIDTSNTYSGSLTLKRNISNNNIKLTGYTKESYDIKITYNDVSDPLVKEQSTRSVSADGRLDVTDLLCGNNVKIEIKSEGKVLGSVDSQTLDSTTKEISIQISDTPSGDTGNISLTIEPFEEGMRSSDYVLSLGKGDKFEKRNIEVSSANVLVDGIPVGSYETLTFGNNKYKTEIISEAISISKDTEYKKTITLEHYDPIGRPGTIKLTVEGQLPKEPSDFTLNLYEKEDGKAEPWKDKISIGPDTSYPIEILNVDPKYNYIELIFKGSKLDYKSNKAKVIINDEVPCEVTLQVKETEPEPEPSKSKYVKTYTLGLTKGKWVLTIEGKQDSEGGVADYKEDKSWKPDYFKVTKEIDGSAPGPAPDSEQPPKDPGTESEVKS